MLFLFILTDVCVYRDLFPSSRCLFMYRDVTAVAKSCYRLSFADVDFRRASLLGQISGGMTSMIDISWGHDSSDFCVRLDNELSVGVLVYALTTGSYLDMRRRGFDVSALRYMRTS